MIYQRIIKPMQYLYYVTEYSILHRSFGKINIGRDYSKIANEYMKYFIIFVKLSMFIFMCIYACAHVCISEVLIFVFIFSTLCLREYKMCTCITQNEITQM
jgi:hypothetical protein